MAATITPLPLTTIYTPPASCSDIETWNGEHLWQYGTNQTGGNCYPPQFKRILNSWYSPGVCPDAWTSAGVVKDYVGFDAMCCPDGFFLKNNFPGYGCNSIVTSILDNVYLTDTAGRAPISSGPFLTTFSPRDGVATVTADVIQVRWENKDSNVARLMAQKTVAGTAGGAQTGTRSTTPVISSTIVPTSGSSGGMSTGAKIGIGVAVPIIVLSLLAIGAVLIWRKRKQKAKREQEPSDDAEPFPELSSQEQKYQESPNRIELYSDPSIKQPLQAPQETEAQEYNELPAGIPVQELSGHEMQRVFVLKSDSVHTPASSNPRSPRKGILR